MNVRNGEEDADSATLNSVQGVFDNFHNASVGWRHHGLWIGWNRSLRITEKIQNEPAQHQEHAPQPVPVKKQRHQPTQQRRRGKLVSVLNHEIPGQRRKCDTRPKPLLFYLNLSIRRRFYRLDVARNRSAIWRSIASFTLNFNFLRVTCC